jgi:hypothetical protein
MKWHLCNGDAARLECGDARRGNGARVVWVNNALALQPLYALARGLLGILLLHTIPEVSQRPGSTTPSAEWDTESGNIPNVWGHLMKNTTIIILTRFSCLEARCVCRQAAVKAAKILTLVGLARSKQDPINRGHGV